MKSNVPWSVKGIDPEARVVAKEAARKAGMTLGEWMSTMIQQVGTEDELGEQGQAEKSAAQTGISADQLRQVVDSLNRLNERLTTTENQVKRSEQQTREAATGLNQAVETVFERLKRLERERREGASTEVLDRVQKLEQSDGEKNRIASLKSLESALTQMVEQFEATRAEAISRVEANENAVDKLESRVDDLDMRVTAGFQEVHDALSAVGTQLDHTERTAKAVMLEAKEAASSTDAEFVERTGKKLQLLGAEIKRSGDQITAVENMVTSLTEKIEAAERRSADGIADVSAELDALRHELADAGLETTGEADSEEEASWDRVAKEAEAKVASLQASYENMVAQLEIDEHKPEAAPKVATASDGVTAAAPSQAPAAREEKAASPEPTLDDFDDLDAIFGTESKSEDISSDEIAEAEIRDELFSEEEPEPRTPAREKIIAAALARKERLARQRQQSEEPDILDDDDELIAALDEASAVDEDGQNLSLAKPILFILGAALIVTVLMAVFMMGGEKDSPSEPALEQPVISSSSPSSTSPAASPDTSASGGDAATTDGVALYNQGVEQLQSASSPEEFREAFNLIRESAIFGYVPARYRLGELYFSGTGTPQDLQSAKRWFTEAALSGNALSMHRLGTLAVDSSVDGQNFELALEWFGRAAEYGVIDSMYNLGFLYDPTSELLPPDMRSAEQAYFWYGVAARQGDPVAPADAANVAATLSSAKVEVIDKRIDAWQPRPFDPAKNDGLQIAN